MAKKNPIAEAIAEQSNTNKSDLNKWSEGKIDAQWSFDGTSDKIETLADALAFSAVDLDTWEVERHIFNKWPTTAVIDGKLVQKANLQIKVWFKKRIDHGVDWDAALKKVHAVVKKRRPAVSKKASGTGIALAADFHFGAYIDDLIRSDKFSIAILSDYLDQVVDKINSQKKAHVHLALLGDFIESFTGLNHRNSWKGLGKGMFGINATILCFEILMERLILRIKNLRAIYIVSGNHDRVTSERDLDPRGEVAQLLAYMFDRELNHGSSGVKVKYDAMVLSEVINGVSYVFTHGHHGFSKKEIHKVIFDHGKQGMYNVLAMGHLHSRQTKKSYSKRQFQVDGVDVVQLDESDSRTIVVPSLFTGNFYSEALGFSSSAGFAWIENNGKGRINYSDYCL